MSSDQIRAGLKALRSGDKRQARRIFAAIVQDSPDDAVSWWNLVLATDDLEQKVRCLKQVMRLRPEHLEARNLLTKTQQQIARPTPIGGIRRPTLNTEENDDVRRANALDVDGGQTPLKRQMGLRLLALATVVLLFALAFLYLVTGAAVSLLPPASTPTSRELVVRVEECVTTANSPATLIFENGTGIDLQVLSGDVGQESSIGIISADGQLRVVATPQNWVRYSAKAISDSGIFGGAVIAVPSGSTCRVSIR